MKSIFKLAIFVFPMLLSGCLQQTPIEVVSEKFLTDLNTVISRNEDFLGQARTNSDKKELQEEFIRLRLQYKKVEAFAEYFAPTTVKQVNGAPLDEVEDEENAVFEPGGLQVIEELIYSDEKLDQEELVRHIRKMQVNTKRIKMLWADIRITDSHVLDALRLELFRLITLGISGFDTPASGNALAESEVVLNSLQDYLSAYAHLFPEYQALDKEIERAITFIKKGKSFNDFDRATFIADHINPLCIKLHQNQKLSNIPFINDRKLLKGSVATMFDKGAFDSEALVSNPKFKSTSERIALGERLFYDVRLSGNGKSSCGSCHAPQLAYTDGFKKSKGISGADINRNAPTIKYAALQQAMFYDLRSPSLEDQASDVIHNTAEMHGSLEKITGMITADEEYTILFRKAFPEVEVIKSIDVQNALASFVRSLSPFDSKFDQYMRGNKRALTDNQVAGFNLFMGKARCGTCHFVPLFNGTVPPDYQRTESEVLGATSNADWKHPVMDSDLGRGAYNRFPQWQHAFKTSSLRNIAKTAPYMHNGALATLQEVMEFYNEGGGAGLGLDVPNQTLAPDKLKLTQPEMQQVIDFMESLTDTSI
ncbi:cytochrome-c peroxidase [Dyadobacter sp. CY343]|uniref:cytochrome-c peroxidase n=1 Tax=Dyadobacter sp. CY343 TaxID=2907299 RepID=UPI001F480C22|nr:cytochrome c peroxidase [Dyadobacter sp. CY343]MCE7062122.1 cytochrome C peroxidase [Dyadobacter sp. CY343]